MPTNGPTMFSGGNPAGGGSGPPDPRVVDALREMASEPQPVTSAVTRRADLAGLGARRAAVAAALQQWSSTTNNTLRTTALAVLAASRVTTVRQEATRASNGLAPETVFEAFFRGIEGRATQESLRELTRGGGET